MWVLARRAVTSLRRHWSDDVAFFAHHFRLTAVFNALSLIAKALTTVLWGMLDNASILGHYALASLPSSVLQRSMMATMIVETRLPGISDPSAITAMIRAAALIDALLMFVVGSIFVAFLAVTRAPLLDTMGFPLLFALGALAFCEIPVSLCVALCKAKRHYYWGFLATNLRVAVTVICVAIVLLVDTPPLWTGPVVWVLSVLVAVAASGIYFVRARLPWPVRADKVFLDEVRRNMVDLMLLRGAMLLFGILPSLILAYTPASYDVGLISFALTLSMFVFMSVMPMVEQIYAPEIALQAAAPSGNLYRTIAQMSVIALAATAALAGAVFLGKGLLFAVLGKVHLVRSASFLPPLLLYQVVMAALGGLTYAFLCQRKYRYLVGIYGISFLAGIVWIASVQGVLARVWGLPFSVAVGLCCAVILALLGGLGRSGSSRGLPA